MNKTLGLYDKYKVERIDGKPLKGGAIVLEFGDPVARIAIFAWAQEMEYHGYHQVSADVLAQLEATQQ